MAGERQRQRERESSSSFSISLFTAEGQRSAEGIIPLLVAGSSLSYLAASGECFLSLIGLVLNMTVDLQDSPR